LFASPNGREEGLAARDRYDMRTDAVLVFLSACETGLNSLVGGQDIIGLQRGFFDSGGSAVIASLWEVSDQATATLVHAFYSAWLGGASIERALRTARIATRAQFPHPNLWAAFQIASAGAPEGPPSAQRSVHRRLIVASGRCVWYQKSREVAAVLIIRRDQMDTLAGANGRLLEHHVYSHIARHHALAVASLPDDVLAARVATGVRRARAYRLRAPRAIAMFVALMFEIAPGFDREPYICALLAAAGDTIEELVATICDRVDAVAWANAALLQDLAEWKRDRPGMAA
jgi:hypothetical protein